MFVFLIILICTAHLIPSVLALILLVIAIFAMMATKFFERRSLATPHGDKYLDNFGDSYWNL